jgi:hypothetical protein
MGPAPSIVVVDANVLYPLTLRDTVLRAAAAGFYQLPDEFLCNLFDLDPLAFVEMLREQAGDLIKLPVTFEELLERLARVVPEFVVAVRRLSPRP